jgi:hypothetical protein
MGKTPGVASLTRPLGIQGWQGARARSKGPASPSSQRASSVLAGAGNSQASSVC